MSEDNVKILCPYCNAEWSAQMEAEIKNIEGMQCILGEHFILWDFGFLMCTDEPERIEKKNYFKPVELDNNQLDDLYAVLHARALSQQYDATIMSRIEKNEVFIPNNPVLERIAIALERIAIALETSKYVASKNNNPYEVTYNKGE